MLSGSASRPATGWRGSSTSSGSSRARTSTSSSSASPSSSTACGCSSSSRSRLLERDGHVDDRRHVLLERTGVVHAVVLDLVRVRRRYLEDAYVDAAESTQVGTGRLGDHAPPMLGVLRRRCQPLWTELRQPLVD